MKRSPLLFSLLAFATFSLACGPQGNSGDAFGGLDTNGDGLLTSEDVSDGELAVFYTRVDPSAGDTVPGESLAITTLDATISPGGSFGWYLTGDLDGSTLSVRFEGDFPLAAGEGTITNGSLDVDDEHFAYASEPGGSVDIADLLEDGTLASGAVVGELELEVFDMMEAATGESIRIDGFAFKSIPVELE